MRNRNINSDNTRIMLKKKSVSCNSHNYHGSEPEKNREKKCIEDHKLLKILNIARLYGFNQKFPQAFFLLKMIQVS